MQKKRPRAAFIFALWIMIAFFALLTYFDANADHVCADEDCPICALLQARETAFKVFLFGAIIVFAAFIRANGNSAINPRRGRFRYDTLISLGVKISA